MTRARLVEISRHGPPEVLRLVERDVPAPGPGEMRIDVAAIGVNFADLMGRLGLYSPAPPPPYVPGFEVAGTVGAAGAGVEAFRPGDAVLAGTRFGGYASALVVRASRALPLPPGWSMEEGAGFLATYATAWHALVTLGRLRPGARLLIHAGAGGLGTAATQIGRHLGARVVATAGGPGKVQFCTAHGAHAAVDYLASGWEARARAAAGGAGFDLVLDSVLGGTFEASMRLLEPAGHLVLCGAASFTPRRGRNWLRLGANWLARPRLDPLALIPRNLTFSGFNLLLLWEDEVYMRSVGEALQALARGGAVRPVIDRSFPLARAAEAHAWVQGRKSRGKVVLLP